MKIERILVPILFYFLFDHYMLAQIKSANNDTIRLINPLFEDIAKQSSTPNGWFDCGFDGESPPDIHPYGNWKVKNEPYHGKTYLGMTVRQNNTWERICQFLVKPLKAGACYDFYIFLAKSPNYFSEAYNRFIIISGVTDSIDNFTGPAVLQIWGGNHQCERKELLATSIPVNHTDWKEYYFRISPKKHYQYLMLEAFYCTFFDSYDGNILLDYASELIQVPCK